MHQENAFSEVSVMNATIKDAMTTRVVAVRAVRLRAHRVSAFPVVNDENKVVGIGSERPDGGGTGLDRPPGVPRE
jgi:hypothetical protein